MAADLKIGSYGQSVKTYVGGIPTRIRFVLLLVILGAGFLLLVDTHTYSGSRYPPPPRYTPGPGGDWKKMDTIISFGDSWSATNFYTSLEQPNEENPFGNPDLPKNGTSHPPKWLYVCHFLFAKPSHYLTMDYNQTFMKCYNLAQGAATIDRSVQPPHEVLNWTKTFREQVDKLFLVNYTAANPVVKWTPESTLFAAWFGVVDISLMVDHKNYLGDNVIRLINVFTPIIEEGGRHFMVLTAPPMYLSPSAHDEGHNPFLERLMIKEFNGRLYLFRKAFIAAHPDATMYIFDAHGFMTTIIQRPENIPETAHLKNTTDNCWDYNPDGYSDAKPWDWFLPHCYVPFDQYLWANHLHPTHVFHNAMAAAIVKDCFAPRRKGYCS